MEGCLARVVSGETGGRCRTSTPKESCQTQSANTEVVSGKPTKDMRRDRPHINTSIVLCDWPCLQTCGFVFWGGGKWLPTCFDLGWFKGCVCLRVVHAYCWCNPKQLSQNVSSLTSVYLFFYLSPVIASAWQGQDPAMIAGSIPMHTSYGEHITHIITQKPQMRYTIAR